MRLIVRCEPRPGEGILGYLLRLVDLNQGGNFSALFGVSGHSVYPALSRADEIISSNSSFGSVRQFPYYFQNPSEIGKTDVIYFHGHKLQRPEVNLHSPKFCSLCLAETLSLSAMWELTHYVACDQHNVMLSEHCSACGCLLSWMRPAVHRCQRCGFDLRNHTPVPASGEIQSFISVILNMIERAPLNNASTAFEAASHHLSLQQLLALCTHLGRPRMIKEKNAKFSYRNAFRTVETFSSLIQDWPLSFREFLRMDFEARNSREQSIELHRYLTTFSVEHYKFVLREYRHFQLSRCSPIGTTKFGFSQITAKNPHAKWYSLHQVLAMTGLRRNEVLPRVMDGRIPALARTGRAGFTFWLIDRRWVDNSDWLSIVEARHIGRNKEARSPPSHALRNNCDFDSAITQLGVLEALVVRQLVGAGKLNVVERKHGIEISSRSIRTLLADLQSLAQPAPADFYKLENLSNYVTTRGVTPSINNVIDMIIRNLIQVYLVWPKANGINKYCVRAKSAEAAATALKKIDQ